MRVGETFDNQSFDLPTLWTVWFGRWRVNSLVAAALATILNLQRRIVAANFVYNRVHKIIFRFWLQQCAHKAAAAEWTPIHRCQIRQLQSLGPVLAVWQPA